MAKRKYMNMATMRNMNTELAAAVDAYFTECGKPLNPRNVPYIARVNGVPKYGYGTSATFNSDVAVEEIGLKNFNDMVLLKKAGNVVYIRKADNTIEFTRNYGTVAHCDALFKTYSERQSTRGRCENIAQECMETMQWFNDSAINKGSYQYNSVPVFDVSIGQHSNVMAFHNLDRNNKCPQRQSEWTAIWESCMSGGPCGIYICKDHLMPWSTHTYHFLVDVFRAQQMGLKTPFVKASETLEAFLEITREMEEKAAGEKTTEELPF